MLQDNNIKIVSNQPGIIVSHNKNPKFNFHLGSDPVSVPEKVAVFLTEHHPRTIVYYRDPKPKRKRSKRKSIKKKIKGDNL